MNYTGKEMAGHASDRTRVSRSAMIPAPKNEKSPAASARYVMIGGFLGAGKTTAVARLAQRLTGAGHRVGLITNDQGSELVDTAVLRSRGFSAEEIPGGCFCCRFNSLVEAARRLSAASTPDVFIAEPVGSCTDLVATVSYPLRRMYGDKFSVAPLSVLVDPARASRMLGFESGSMFSEKVRYIYRKQLEEADVIVINKCDSAKPAQREKLQARLIEMFPRARMFEVSARAGSGLDAWFDYITLNDQSAGTAMEVDYDTYAEGEALLGWLNAAVQVSSPEAFDGNELLTRMTTAIQGYLSARGAEVAHLKMTLSPAKGLNEMAAISLVRNEFVPELSEKLEDEVTDADLIINLRAEAAPNCLKEAVEMSLQSSTSAGFDLKLMHLEHFRPGKPQPTHRVAVLK